MEQSFEIIKKFDNTRLIIIQKITLYQSKNKKYVNYLIKIGIITTLVMQNKKSFYCIRINYYL